MSKNILAAWKGRSWKAPLRSGCLSTIQPQSRSVRDRLKPGAELDSYSATLVPEWQGSGSSLFALYCTEYRRHFSLRGVCKALSSFSVLSSRCSFRPPCFPAHFPANFCEHSFRAGQPSIVVAPLECIAVSYDPDIFTRRRSES